jgi:membrane-associated phospholipid phosphatase
MPSTTQRRRLARIITNLLNPLVLPLILFWYAASRLESEPVVILQVVGIGVLFYSIIPLLILLIMRKRKLIDGMEVERRELRLRPFIYGILSMLTGASLYSVFGLQNGDVYQALAMIPIVNAMIAAFITLRWKISIHAISITTAAVVVLYLSGPQTLRWPPFSTDTALLAASFTAIIVAVQWSRIVLNYHSTSQVISGVLLAICLTTLQLMVYFPTLLFDILV